MDKYLSSFREMLSLRGLTDHTITSYSTYISAYLQYLSDNGLTAPEDASWQQMRDFIFWIQNTRDLSDRTINACISQLRFFTLYVLHKPWDPYQLPFRKFDSYTPFIPSREEMKTFLFSISDIKFKTILCLMFSSGLRVGEVRHLKCSDIEHSRKRIHIRASKNRSDRYVPLSDNVWEIILRYWYSFPAERLALSTEEKPGQAHRSPAYPQLYPCTRKRTRMGAPVCFFHGYIRTSGIECPDGFFQSF